MSKFLSVFASAALLAAMAGSAGAAPVRGGDGPKPPSEAEQRAAERKAAQDEKAYRDALERIPEPAKKNNDPWSKMR
jgi:hypothetical protein